MKPIKRFDDSDFEALLASVADDYSEKLADGETPDVEDYARQHPTIADALRRVLPALNSLDKPMGPSPPGFKQIGGHLKERDTLGDFRIVREIGRGGMGIVYEAEEQSLGRSVALKVLPFTAMLDEKQLARFRNEARAAATLSHRNIVPVYSFGSQGGVHYYSMECIRGQSMAELIRDLRLANDRNHEPNHDIADALTRIDFLTSDNENSTTRDSSMDSAAVHQEPPAADSISANHLKNGSIFFRNVARLGIQAALAIDHAHTAGVLHRDIKPANMMVDPNLQLSVTDFGLARLGDDAGVTMTGDVVGTARYMSPEQVLGNRAVIDHRSDIYSLGITLYELATLRVAFDGEDRYELWRQISLENPPPPRKVDHRIPVDLETIILKSIEKSPSDRYQTAAELGNDLQRFLDNKPILAKPPTLLASTAKWAQRHPSVVWATMGVMATVIAILVTSIGFIHAAYNAVQAQRERAESHLQLARDVIDDTYNIELERLKHAPGMTQKQRESLQALMKFYEQLPTEELADDSLFHDSVRATLRLGDIYSILGQYRDARNAYRSAINAAEQLCNRTTDPTYQASLVLAHSGLGQVQLAIGERSGAISSHRTANELIDKLIASYPDHLSVQRLAAEKIYLPIALGRTQDQVAAFRSVIAELDQLGERFPHESAFPHAKAKAQESLGVLLQSIGQVAEAETMFRSAVEIQQELVVRNPDDPTFTLQQANGLRHLAVLLRNKGTSSVAMSSTRQAVELMERLSASFPYRVKYQTSLAQLRNDLGTLLYAKGKPQEAAAEFEQAIAILEPLVQSDPETPAYRFDLANNLNNLGAVTSKTSPAKGRVHKQRAMALWKTLAARYPEDAQYQQSIAVGYANSAGSLDLQHRIDAYKNATSILEDLAHQFPERIEYTQKLIRYKTLLGNELTKAKQISRAEAEFNDVIQLSESFSNRYPEFAREDEMAINSVTRAELTWRMGKVEETILARHIAIDRYRLLLEQSPENTGYKSELCSQVKRLAYAHVSLGQFAKALDCCHESIALNQQLIEQHPDVSKYLKKLVRRYDLLTLVQLKMGRLKQAEAGLRLKLDTIRRLATEFPDSETRADSTIEAHVRLANLVIESDPTRIDDAIAPLHEATELARRADAPFLAMTLRLQQAMLLNDAERFTQARRHLLAALQTANDLDQHVAESDLKERASVAQLQWQIGAELARSGEVEQSQLTFQRLTESSPTEPLMRQGQAWGIANWSGVTESVLQRASAISKQQVEREPENGVLWLNRGFVQVRAGDHANAIASLDRAKSLNAPLVPTNLLLAVAHAKLGNISQSQQHYDQSKEDVLFGEALRTIEMRRLRDEAKTAIENVDPSLRKLNHDSP